MFPPIALEVIVLIIGLLLLLVESFSTTEIKDTGAKVTVAALVFLFFFSFFASGNPPAPELTPFWKFYSADPMAMFFKRIALVSTALVLVMAMEYRSTLSQFL